MRKLIKLKVIFLVFLIAFIPKTTAADTILPIPKPNVDKETKDKTAKKKNIYPKKKPRDTKNEIESPIVEKVETNQEEIFIYPKKKPIIVQKKIDKAVIKSTILSKKDFQIAKSAFKEIENKRWQTALKLSKKARDKTVFELINYLYLKRPSNSASFYDYTSFINNNPNYPRISRLRYLA